jgi:DNA replication regulator SLD3
MLLPRSKLPLSFLDLVPSANALPQSRLFETHVKILELEERMGNQPVVLIARFEDGRTLYAVEREARGLYVLCKLGSWVDMRQLKAAAVMSKQEMPNETEKHFGRNSLLQQKDALPSSTTESHKYDKKKRLAIEAIQSMVKRPSTTMSTELPQVESSTKLETEDLLSTLPISTDSPGLVEAPVPPTGEEIFDNVRTQYLEALYLSKVRILHRCCCRS